MQKTVKKKKILYSSAVPGAFVSLFIIIIFLTRLVRKQQQSVLHRSAQAQFSM